jgi:hypothetical protein
VPLILPDPRCKWKGEVTRSEYRLNRQKQNEMGVMFALGLALVGGARNGIPALGGALAGDVSLGDLRELRLLPLQYHGGG